ALGQKQTLGHLRAMSALPPKADIGTQSLNVRFVPKADIRRSRAPTRSGPQQIQISLEISDTCPSRHRRKSMHDCFCVASWLLVGRQIKLDTQISETCADRHAKVVTTAAEADGMLHVTGSPEIGDRVIPACWRNSQLETYLSVKTLKQSRLFSVI